MNDTWIKLGLLLLLLLLQQQQKTDLKKPHRNNNNNNNHRLGRVKNQMFFVPTFFSIETLTLKKSNFL
jgi:hypothetical protein